MREHVYKGPKKKNLKLTYTHFYIFTVYLQSCPLHVFTIDILVPVKCLFLVCVYLIVITRDTPTIEWLTLMLSCKKPNFLHPLLTPVSYIHINSHFIINNSNIILNISVNFLALSTDSVPYHSSFTFEAGHGEKHVYDFGPDPGFDETELNSIQFMDIIETYGISREASRELIYLFRTILQNNLIGAEFKNGKLFITDYIGDRKVSTQSYHFFFYIIR